MSFDPFDAEKLTARAEDVGPDEDLEVGGRSGGAPSRDAVGGRYYVALIEDGPAADEVTVAEETDGPWPGVGWGLGSAYDEA